MLFKVSQTIQLILLGCIFGYLHVIINQKQEKEIDDNLGYANE